MSELKIGAYVCRGCGLGERLDTAQLATIAQREGKAQVVREHEFLCNASGVAMIRQDIEQEGVNHVVIAACSRRAKTDAFSFDNVALSRANLREGVIWIASAAEDKKELVQEMAADYVRMACAESAKMQVPSANPDRGARGLEDRLRGAAGREERDARRLGGGTLEARTLPGALRRSGGYDSARAC